jgi:hypothetical protein
MLTRYASALQVREIHGGPRNCRRVRSGKGGPRQDVTLLARSGSAPENGKHQDGMNPAFMAL